jgi:hypothetical protein
VVQCAPAATFVGANITCTIACRYKGAPVLGHPDIFAFSVTGPLTPSRPAPSAQSSSYTVTLMATAGTGPATVRESITGASFTFLVLGE